MRVEQDRCHDSSQDAPVVKSSSSPAALIATPANRPFRACGPVAGTRRATTRPCLVISTSSPAATSSSTARIFAFASVAVIFWVIWSLYQSDSPVLLAKHSLGAGRPCHRRGSWCLALGWVAGLRGHH